MTDAALSPEEAAAYLGCKPSTARELMRSGRPEDPFVYGLIVALEGVRRREDEERRRTLRDVEDVAA